MNDRDRAARLVALTEELARLLTAEERRIYCDPVENLQDLLTDLTLEAER